MAIAHIQKEIDRFLSSKSPEVLCIKGRWGVGKTYAWKRFLSEAAKDNSVVLSNYAYVSLFGVNSLDDLRFAIVENTIPISQIDAGASPDSFSSFLERAQSLGRKTKPMIDAVSAFFNRRGIADIIYKTAFLAVREQIICIDDLERAGTGLDVRDILGLTSFLREERKCKIVLLLNDEELLDKQEFEKQLEKVADIMIAFQITPTEAASISLSAEKPYLRDRAIALGITNIRVLKKIERTVDRLTQILLGVDEGVIKQVVATTVLSSWSTMQPHLAPSLEYIRAYNSFASALRQQAADAPDEHADWSTVLTEYGYGSTDQLDEVIIDGVQAGYFDEGEVLGEARAAEKRFEKASGGLAFSTAWQDLYHGSLQTPDDEFLDALHTSAVAEAAAITPLNINSAIRLLKEYGRPDQAAEVLDKYMIAHNEESSDFFDLSSHHFSADDPIDPDLRQRFDAQRTEYINARNPNDVIAKIADDQGWSDTDIATLATLTADDFERIFETLRGRDLRRSIQNLQSIGSGSDEHAMKIGEAVEAALRNIGRKSPLRARKVARFGVSV